MGGALGLNNGSMWGIGFLLVVMMISLLIFKSYGLDRGMTISSILTFIVGFLFLKAGWINNFVFTLTLIYVAFALYYLFAERSQEEA